MSSATNSKDILWKIYKIIISALSWQKSARYLLHKQFVQVSWSIFTDDGLYNSGLSILAPELSAQKICRPLNWATWVKAGRAGDPLGPARTFSDQLFGKFTAWCLFRSIVMKRKSEIFLDTIFLFLRFKRSAANLES